MKVYIINGNKSRSSCNNNISYNSNNNNNNNQLISVSKTTQSPGIKPTIIIPSNLQTNL